MTGARAAFGVVDGDLKPLQRLCVPVTDRGFLLGDAVFETLRTYRGRLFALDGHLDRLEASLDGVGIEDAPGRAVIADWARAAVRATRQAVPDAECVVRVTVTRGDGPHGISTKGAGPARVVVIARVLPEPGERVYAEGLRVVTASVRRAPRGVQDPTIKATSALNLILARREADEAGADEALLLDAEGRYLEASAANLFVVQGEEFFASRGEHGVLEGVTAGIVEDLLVEEGFTPQWGPVPKEVLRGADEVLLTQTTREVLPVVQVDSRPVGDGRPGPVAARLRDRFLGRLDDFLDPADE
jgi:branched-chain amino acid aminotransferase